MIEELIGEVLLIPRKLFYGTDLPEVGAVGCFVEAVLSKLACFDVVSSGVESQGAIQCPR